MREILFRGKRQYTGEWAESVCPLGVMHAGHLCDDFDPSTVGQFTGLTDKNGKRIFEGDVVDVLYDVEYVGVAAQRMGRFEVVFHNGCFMKKNKRGLFHFTPSDKCKAVGTVHDNPELLEGGVGVV